MKKTNGILVLCLLFTSCYSYRPLKGEPVILENMYQIRFIENSKKNLRILEMGDTIKGISASGKKFEIPTDRVAEIRKKKFSIVKTIVIPTVAAGSVLLAIGNYVNNNLFTGSDFSEGGIK